MMSDFIYCLKEVADNTIFYVGRTIDPHRRMLEHRLGAKHYKPFDEDKYYYASALDKLCREWSMQIVQECGEGTENFEDYWINKFRMEGHPLQNMRAGDDEAWNGRNYANPGEFIEARTKAILTTTKLKEAAKLAEKMRIKVDNDPLSERVLYSFEKPHEKFISPAMKEMLARRNRIK
jgi:hypothetical protein